MKSAQDRRNYFRVSLCIGKRKKKKNFNTGRVKFIQPVCSNHQLQATRMVNSSRYMFASFSDIQSIMTLPFLLFSPVLRDVEHCE